MRTPDFRQQVDAINAENRYWSVPLIQIIPSYKRSTGCGDPGCKHAGCAYIFRADGERLSLYLPCKTAFNWRFLILERPALQVVQLLVNSYRGLCTSAVLGDSGATPDFHRTMRE